jgi:hypothetical protein
MCRHKRERNKCVPCGGSSVCEHNKRKFICKECNGTNLCEHNSQKGQCKICDPVKYLVNLQRNRLREIFNKKKLVKDKHTIEYLGCSEQEFYDYIISKMKPGMTFDNIHLDHIKPVSRFNLKDTTELMKCCHYTNIQPLLSTDNLQKYNKWSDEDEKQWIKNVV